MAKHHSQVVKKATATHDAGRHASGHAHRLPRVISPRSRQPMAAEKQEVAPFLAWPSHLFEMLLSSWHDLTPMEAWVANWHGSGKRLFPKTQSMETDKEYLYRVELPGISRGQIALTVQNGAIMLRVEESDEQRK